MNVLLIPAAGLLLLAIAFASLFARLISRDRTTGFPDDSEEVFSPAKYRVLERLLNEADQNFLRSQPGWNERKERTYRKTRIKMFRGYLHQLSDDFNKVCKAIKVLIVTSAVDRPDLAGLLMKQKFLFAVGMISVEFKLSLYGLGWSGSNLRYLMQSLEAMRSQLQAFAAVAQASQA
jgi:hypothetical protein